MVKAVSYTAERPYFYKDDLPSFADTLAQDDLTFVERAYDRLLFTKSPQWEYEEEVRLVFHDRIKGDEQQYLVRLDDSEVVQLYLGCRMKPRIGTA